MEDRAMEERAMEERPIMTDDRGNPCFACSPTNPQGLHLTFVQVADHEVECRWTAPEHLSGSPGIIHGGIQATVLDETIGYAARTVLGTGRQMATVEFSLRYRRPTPAGEPLVIRASVERTELPYLFLEGSIVRRSPAGDEVLTTATARWKALD